MVETVTEVWASDDLMTRAEKIVRVTGNVGAVGGMVINVYRLLQAYQEADEAQADLEVDVR